MVGARPEYLWSLSDAVMARAKPDTEVSFSKTPVGRLYAGKRSLPLEQAKVAGQELGVPSNSSFEEAGVEKEKE